jgi:hypothetical protein
MKYIRVWNKSDGVNRLHLQYLGLSTKRYDESTIGQFGSGIKYAPILALRKDIELTIVSQDDDGQYFLKYKVVEQKGIDVIYYDYGTYEVPSSFTLDAGRLSWEDEFQIYREVVSNAKDGVKSNDDWGAELVDKIMFYPDEFSVFISATPEMVHILKNHDYYYCDNTPIIFTHNDDISVLQNNYGNTAIYCKTVLTHESEDKSFFHYNIKSVKLNEERKLANYYSTQYDIARALAYMTRTDVIEEVLKCVIGGNPIDQYSVEFWEYPSAAYEYLKANSAWEKAFVNQYGNRAVVLNQIEYSVPGIERKVKELGYIPIRCKSENLYLLLKTAKAKVLNDVAGENLSYDLSYDYEKYPNLVQALNIMEDYIEEFGLMAKKVALFSPNSSDILGLTINAKKPIPERQILITKTLARTGSVESIVATLMHEYDHYSTGLSDAHPEFRDLADTRLGELIVKAYKPKILYVEKGSADIKVKISDLPYLQGVNFHTESSDIFNGVVLNVGTRLFVIKSKEIVSNLVGKLTSSDDNMTLCIPNAFYEPLKDDNISIEEIRGGE